MELVICIAAGQSLQGPGATWQEGPHIGTNLNNNVLLTNGGRFAIKDVKLEISPQPTPFVRDPLDFKRCQRYYEKSYEFGIPPGTVTTAGSEIVIPTSNVGMHSIRFKEESPQTPQVWLRSPSSGERSLVFDSTDHTDEKGAAANVSKVGFHIQFDGVSGHIYFVHWVKDARPFLTTF